MTTTAVRPLTVRRRLGPTNWGVPAPFGPTGWRFIHRRDRASIFISEFDMTDGTEWIHASINRADRMPDYTDLKLLHHAVFPGWAYQVFAPPQEHINLSEHVLHLWGRADGSAHLPNFGAAGTI